jgi:hypothetical protein
VEIIELEKRVLFDFIEREGDSKNTHCKNATPNVDLF